LDQLAKYERAKTTERTRRGRLRRARGGVRSSVGTPPTTASVITPRVTTT
jgi:DNA invertase Pin-like site-specific DNA recombinase